MKKLLIIITLPIVTYCGYLAYQVIDVNKNSAFQLVATQCTIDRTGDSCNELIKFGVSKELYLDNVEYKEKVDSMAIEKIIDGSNKIIISTEMIAKIAKFTLNFAEKKQQKS